MPTTSPTSSGMLQFVCYFNDDSIRLSLSVYAKIMVDMILDTIPPFLLHSINYEETEYNPLAPWKRGGISDFNICYIFHSGVQTMDTGCPSYIHTDIEDDNGDSIAIGLFGIVADESLISYQTRIIEIMTSQSFKTEFDKNMNNGLSNISTNSSDRRLISYDSFNAVRIGVFDPLNVSLSTSSWSTTDIEKNILKDDNIKSDDSILIISIVCGIILLVIIFIAIAFLRKCEQRTRNAKQETDGNDYNPKLEMHENGKIVNVDQLEGFGETKVSIEVDLESSESAKMNTKGQDLNEDDEDELDMIDAVNRMYTNIAGDEEQNENEEDIIGVINTTHGNDQ